MLDLLSSCKICPRQCGVNRLNGEIGFCGGAKDLKIYNYQLHLGEEPPISGTKGSGTIFFTYCNSRCVYCQNYKFSQLGEGKEVGIDGLSGIMLDLQKKGSHNINLVTPTHYVPQIISAIKISRGMGLNIPIVYNTNGYELPETLELLKGIIDIYLPDMRYSNNEMAFKYSSLPDYVSYNRKAVKLMYEQVGDLIIEDGIAKRGLIIRLLVLPNNIAGTRDTMKFIKEEISPNVHISLMSQYYPVFKANQYPGLVRQIAEKEYEDALNMMLDLGLDNGWCQDTPSSVDRTSLLGVNFSSL